MSNNKVGKFFVEEETCPVCGSSNITYHEVEVEDHAATYPCECKECGAIWREEYSLTFTGVSHIHDENGNELCEDVIEVNME